MESAMSPEVPTEPQLPQLDLPGAPAVASYLTMVVGTLVTLITLVHPDFSIPPIAQAVIAPVSQLIVGAVLIVHLIFHHKTQVAVLNAHVEMNRTV